MPKSDQFCVSIAFVWTFVKCTFGRRYRTLAWRQQGSDTFTGWAIGSFTGILWGVLDPYDALLRRGAYDAKLRRG